MLISATMGGAALAAAQAPPGTDVYLAELDLSTHPPGVATLTNVSAHEGYDNQPFFEPGGSGLLFTSTRDQQTDIASYDMRSGTKTWLTETPEAEYSATVLPDGSAFSVIWVESDGTQRLWAFDRNGANARLLLPGVAPVGYHAWNGNGDLVTFVLGEPATLQAIDFEADSGSVVAANIGRSLHNIPKSLAFSFLEDGEAWQIRRYEPGSGDISNLVPALAESQDMAWTPDGRILMASGSTLYVRHPERDPEWRVVADLADAGFSSITRLAVSSDGTRLALVAADGLSSR